MSNVIHAEHIENKINGSDLIIRTKDINAEYQDYTTDESRMQGTMDGIAFPQNEEELSAILSFCKKENLKITFSGARTGITGGAVPDSGIVISFDKMNKILGMEYDEKNNIFYLRCQPGVVLADLKNAVTNADFPGTENWTSESLDILKKFKASGKFIYAPDPTELSATVGGTVACNASGARSFKYGPTRGFVYALRAVLEDSSIISLTRGENTAKNNGSFILELPDGSKREGKIPSYKMPNVKNAAGFYAEPSMDLIDLFIGCEGTLGVISEVTLRLVPDPGEILGIVAFFKSEADAAGFVRKARGETDNQAAEKPLSLEYFDDHSLDLLRKHREESGTDSPIPSLPQEAKFAVYAEWAFTEETFEDTALSAVELLESSGSSEDTAWTATEPNEIERIKAFRHALPEAVNQIIGERRKSFPELTKLGTDMAVPDNALETILEYYRSELGSAGLEYVIFGHIGDNHLHVNILPKDMDEYRKGKEIYKKFAKKAVDLGGTVSAEHGIGKLKREFLKILYGKEGIDQMREVKKVFDPEGRLNAGNVFG